MEKKKAVLHIKKEADFPYDEAIKALRTNIQFCGSNVRMIMITSTVPEEGKSNISLEIAASLAQIGKKVLLIDGDIRRSTFASKYHVDQMVPGLSQYLSGQCQLEEMICQTETDGMDIIFSGPYAPNPAELLEEPALDKLLLWCRENYDYVIVDTPPINSVIDGAVIAPKCDGVILVTASGAVSYKLVQKAKSQLDKTGCRILGVVLNKVDTGKGGYYYNKYGGYYKRYGGYYGKDQEGK